MGSSKRPKGYGRSGVTTKGSIRNSFNDSLVIEDYTGGLPVDLSSLRLSERFVPTVINLKEITGSFNRRIILKRFPAPAEPKHDYCGDHWWHHDDADWVQWLLLLLVFGAFVIFLLTRKSSPTATSGTSVPPSNEELEIAMQKAKNTGSIFHRNADGSYEICFQDPKPEQKPNNEKKEEVKETSSPGPEQK